MIDAMQGPCNADLTAPTPAEARAGASAYVGGAEALVRWALAAGIVFQAAQRFAKTGYELSEYGRSLWYVNYQYGFVRRGLAGELLRQVLGTTPSIAEVDLVQNVLSLVLLGVLTALVVLLCRRRTLIAYATAALLVAAPFSFDTVGGQRRPDQFGYIALIVIGTWAATRAVDATKVAVVGGVAFGISAFFSEASPLIIAPWFVVIVIATARVRLGAGNVPRRFFVFSLLPSILAFMILAANGRATSELVAQLESAAPPIIGGHGTVFPYLEDTFRSSFERVVHGPGNKPFSVVVGAIFVGLLAYCARGCVPYVRNAIAWLVPARSLRVAWTMATLAAAVVLFALGFDWLRWITAIAFVALVTAAVVVLIEPHAAIGPVGRDAWHRPLPAAVDISTSGLMTVIAGTYLLVLAPLPNFIKNVDDAAQTVLSVPR